MIKISDKAEADIPIILLVVGKKYLLDCLALSGGTTIKSLFKYIKASRKNYDELNIILGTSYTPTEQELTPKLNVDLPKEFTPFIEMKKNNIVGRHALNYLLKTRGISFEDIIKHNIGYCEGGKYNNKIINIISKNFFFIITLFYNF
jgi:hypothetical protein